MKTLAVGVSIALSLAVAAIVWFAAGRYPIAMTLPEHATYVERTRAYAMRETRIGRQQLDRSTYPVSIEGPTNICVELRSFDRNPGYGAVACYDRRTSEMVESMVKSGAF